MVQPQNASSTSQIATVAQTSIHWGAIFSGLFVALIIYYALMSLGLAIGGSTLQDILRNQDGARELGAGAALWTIASTLIALFAGGVVSGRVGGLLPTRVGRIQGIVIASLFFMLMATQAGVALGLVGLGVSSAVDTVRGSVTNMASTNLGQQMIEDAIGDLNLKTQPTEVAKGVAARLMSGNGESAFRYLAHQAGITPDDARSRVEGFRQQFNDNARRAAAMAAKSARLAGWTLFFAMFGGAFAGMLGGGFGAIYNLRSPISETDDRAMRASFAH